MSFNKVQFCQKCNHMPTFNTDPNVLMSAPPAVTQDFIIKDETKIMSCFLLWCFKNKKKRIVSQCDVVSQLICYYRTTCLSHGSEIVIKTNRTWSKFPFIPLCDDLPVFVYYPVTYHDIFVLLSYIRMYIFYLQLCMQYSRSPAEGNSDIIMANGAPRGT